jgi:hypothetical protein
MSSPSNEVNLNDPQIPVRQDLMDGQGAAAGGSGLAVQNAPLGTKLRLSDRTYYYACASASLAGGTVVCAPPVVGSYQSGLLLVAAAAVGAKTLSVTSTGVALAVNSMAEGTFIVATGTNIGEQYRIKSNTVASAGISQITLYDGLNTAITSGAGFAIVPNAYNLVFVGSEGLHTPVGVTPCNVTSGGYFWLQTFGPAAPTHVGATPAGAALRMGTTGSVTAFFATGTLGATASVQPDYSISLGKNSYLAATAGQANPVFLNIMN